MKRSSPSKRRRHTRADFLGKMYGYARRKGQWWRFEAGAMNTCQVRALIRWAIQGDGYRHWTALLADELLVTRKIRNLPDGSVEGVAQGASIDLFIGPLWEDPRFANGTEIDTAHQDISEAYPESWIRL